MVIHPDFYRPLIQDRAAERRQLGLPAEGPVGVVMFGGSGARTMDAVAQALPDVPLILLCGHNAALAERLRAQRGGAPRAVVGFTREVRRYMALGDFFIGKPGPGSLSEAVQQGLPLLTVRNAFTVPQERYNTVWVAENGLGLVLRSYAALGPAVATLLADLPAYRDRVARVRNRAVFEVPEILASILQGAAARVPEPHTYGGGGNDAIGADLALAAA
jgi:UDP-N-acetylglucosamine:LPS N-acetylglucosamine transferase